MVLVCLSRDWTIEKARREKLVSRGTVRKSVWWGHWALDEAFPSVYRSYSGLSQNQRWLQVWLHIPPNTHKVLYEP